jgi:hypothetical protein
MASVAETWARKDFDAVRAWAQTLPQADQTSAQEGTLRVMEENDPAQAAKTLQELGSVSEVSSTVQDWAKTDLDGAAQWVKQLPAGPFRGSALNGLLAQWRDQDPCRAAEFVAAMPAEEGQQQFLSWVLSSWTGKDSKAAIDWVDGLADGPMRDAGLKAVCHALAESKPMEAASFVASLAPGEVQSQLAGGVAHGWAVYDPMAALQWVAAFPEGPARTSAIEQMGAGLFQLDAPGLGASRKWLDETSLFSAEEKLNLFGK